MQINVDDETFDGLVVAYLKDSVDTIKNESRWMSHPEDRHMNAKLLPAFLTVLSYFMTSEDFEQYAWHLFSDKDEGEDDEG